MSSNMNESRPICTACAKDAKSRCGGCKLPFCSTDCQKLIWSTHKALCKADPYIFHPAALTAREVADLRPIVHKPFGLQNAAILFGPDMTYLETAGQFYGDEHNFNFTEEEIIRIITTPPPWQTTDSYIWGQREQLLRHTREHVANLYRQEGCERDPRLFDPWSIFPHVSTMFQNVALQDPAQPETPAVISFQLMRRFNTFFRQALVYSTLKAAVFKETGPYPPPDLTLPMMLAAQRMERSIDNEMLCKHDEFSRPAQMAYCLAVKEFIPQAIE